MVIPSMIFVVDDSCTKAPSRVDAGSGDGDSCQVHEKDCEPDGEWSQNLQTHAIKRVSK